MNLYCAEFGGQDYTYKAGSQFEAEAIAEYMGWTYLGELQEVFEVTDEMLAMIERDGETLH